MSHNEATIHPIHTDSATSNTLSQDPFLKVTIALQNISKIVAMFLNTFMIGAAIVQDNKLIWSLFRSKGLIHQLSAMQVLIVEQELPGY